VNDISIHRAEPGFWLGESALLSGAPRMVSLIAATDCLVFHIPAAAMERLTIKKPEAWRAFYRQSHINQMQTARLLAESIALSPRARFSRLLLRLAENGDEIVGTQESLGALLGLRITTCKRIVASLVAAQAIESGYGRIKIRDKDVLERFALEETDNADLPFTKKSDSAGHSISEVRQIGKG
jgi:CRP-like cAMP-binding protein